MRHDVPKKKNYRKAAPWLLLAILVAVALLLLLFSACQAEDPEAPPTTPPEEVAGIDESPSDVGPLRAEVWLKNPRFGTELAADGTLVATHDAFAPGEVIHFFADVDETVPAGSTIRIVWYGPDDLQREQSTLALGPDADVLHVWTEQTADWPLGEHRIEVFIGDEEAIDAGFDLVAAEELAAERDLVSEGADEAI